MFLDVYQPAPMAPAPLFYAAYHTLPPAEAAKRTFCMVPDMTPDEIRDMVQEVLG